MCSPLAARRFMNAPLLAVEEDGEKTATLLKEGALDNPRGAARCYIAAVAWILLSATSGLISSIIPEMQIDYFVRTTSCAAGFTTHAEAAASCSGHASVANGVSGSLSALGAILLSSAYGAKSDEVGRRGLFLIGAVALFLPTLVLWTAPNSIGMYYIVRILVGFLPSASALLYAIVADLVPPESRLRWFGLVSSTFMVGMAIGTGTASVLAPQIGPEGLLNLSFGIGVMALIVLMLAAPETLNTGEPDPHSKGGPSRVQAQLGSLHQVMFPGKAPGPEQRLLRDISWLALVAGLPEMGILSVAFFYGKIRLSLDGEEMAVYGARLMFLGCWSCVAFSTVLLSLFQRIYGGDWARIFQITLWTNFVHSLIYIAMWCPQVYALNGLIAGASYVQGTILRAFVSRALPADVQGRASGILAAVAGISSCVAPSLWGVLLMQGERHGCPWVPFAVGCVSVVVASWMTSRLSLSVAGGVEGADCLG